MGPFVWRRGLDARPRDTSHGYGRAGVTSAGTVLADCFLRSNLQKAVHLTSSHSNDILLRHVSRSFLSTALGLRQSILPNPASTPLAHSLHGGVISIAIVLTGFILPPLSPRAIPVGADDG